MSMYDCINGFTKEKMKEIVELKFKGKSFCLENNKCYYRLGELKCIAGCFIKDEDYNSNLENKSIHYLNKSSESIRNSMPLNSMPMRTFQTLHDDLDFKDDLASQKQTMLDWIDKHVN